MVRKTVVFLVVVSLASLAFAQGLSWPIGETRLKLEDGALYVKRDGQGNLYSVMSPTQTVMDMYTGATPWATLPLGADITANCNLTGAEAIGIWQVTSAFVNGVQILPMLPPGYELTGISAGKVVSKVFKAGAYSVMIHYTPTAATVVTPVGGAGPRFDLDDAPGGPAASHLPNPGWVGAPANLTSGGVAQMFLDPTADFNVDPDNDHNPLDDWDLSDPLNPKFPTVTDGFKVAELALTPLVAYDGITTDPLGNPLANNVLFCETIVTNPLTGAGTGGWDVIYLNSINEMPLNTRLGAVTGIVLEDWATSSMPTSKVFNLGDLGGDAKMAAKIYWGGDRGVNWNSGGWPFMSEDPIQYFTVPEPASLALLGAGLIVLVRRRKRS